MENRENSRIDAIEAILERSAIESERMNAEFKQQLMQLNAEAERRNAEAERMNAEFKQQLMQSKAEADKRAAEADKRAEEVAQETKKLTDNINQLGKQLGGMANSNGDMAQDFFFNALFKTKTLFGQVFDAVNSDRKRKIKKTGVEVQYDITLDNGKSFCIVEVKYKANTNDVVKIATKMVKPFREVFPEHADKKLYLALASMSFDKHVEKACKENGIAMIKQVGDTIEVYDENMKVF